jgi:hypothetical protein
MTEYEIQDINGIDLQLSYDLVTIDPTVKSAIESYFRFLKLQKVTLKSSSAIRQEWFETHIRPVFPKILLHIIIHGYCGYIKDTINVDASRDKEWMKVNKKIRDDNNEKYNVTHPYVIIPDFNQFKHKIKWSKKNLRKEVFAENLSEDKFKKSKGPKIEIITCSRYPIPDAINGRIQTPIRSLLNDFNEKRQMEKFNLQACYSLSHPVGILVPKELTSDEINSRMESTEFGQNGLNDAKDNAKYYYMNSINDNLQSKIREIQTQFENQMEEDKAYFIDASDGKVTKTRLINTIERSKPLPAEMDLTKNNPPLAQAPNHIPEMHHRWTENVAKVCQLPYSLLSKDKMSGATGKQYVDADFKLLQETIGDLSLVMESVFKNLYTILEMDDDEEFSLHPQPFMDFDMLLQLYDKALIDKEQIQTQIENSYSLPRNKNSTNTSITHEMLADMRKTESITESQYKKAMGDIYGYSF